MKSFRSRLAVALATAAAMGLCAAAPPISNTDPLAAIDLNRDAIIADIVQGFDGDRAALAKRLAGLRADRLLSASLASSRRSLESILDEAERSRDGATRRIGAKALGSAASDLLYTPLPPCRMIDTRGYGAPIQGGAFSPDMRRSYAPDGLCNLPTTGVATILISFTTQNLTPGSGGYLAILAPGAPVTASVDIFNLNSEWSASSTVVATGSAAQFDVFVSRANSHLVIDVLGYFSSFRGSIDLANSTESAGNILKGGIPFIHNFGSENTFAGTYSGNFTMSGFRNSAFGTRALPSNTDGAANTATGAFALFSNTTGSSNTATGVGAMSNNLGGVSNSAHGAGALGGNTEGYYNTASGEGALSGNRTGAMNTAAGWRTLTNNSAGSANTAIGSQALYAFAIGDSNIAVGAIAGIALNTGSGNIYIGSDGEQVEDNTIHIGRPSHTRAFVAGIRGVTTGMNDAIPVFIDGNGQLGTVSSSRRFKGDVANMESASSALMKLRPVTFHYEAKGSSGPPRLQYGLIAEEVAQVYPDLVANSADGLAETVMYQFLPPMLLNEFQKQQRMIEVLTTEIAELKRRATLIGR